MKPWKEELVAAFHKGDEARARALVAQQGAQPRKLRALLEAMLEDPDALVRQTAAFALGELGEPRAPSASSNNWPWKKRVVITMASLSRQSSPRRSGDSRTQALG